MDGLPKFPQRDNKQYIQKTRYGQVSFVYWTPVNRLSHEITIFACPSHFHSVILLFFLGPIYFISLFVFFHEVALVSHLKTERT